MILMSDPEQNEENKPVSKESNVPGIILLVVVILVAAALFFYWWLEHALDWKG